MNLPENLSPAATSIYNQLSANPSGQTVEQLVYAATKQPEGYPQAIATADSLVIKGITGKEKEGEETIYTLLKQPTEMAPDKEYTGEGYVEGEGETDNNDANAEEQRMIDLLEKNGNKLPESKLFSLYDGEEAPGGADTDGTKEIEDALHELTDAGVVTKEDDIYHIKQ